jgi:rare lipoprotein A
MKNITFLIVILFLLNNCTTVANLQKYDNNNLSLTSEKMVEAPYEMNGKWFFPYDYKELVEIGTASRINDLNFGDRTITGEVFHPDVSSGAHRSLGLASNVRVTNIENGFSMIVRVNHRGAYSNTNVIELSDIVFNKLKLNENGNLIKLELINANETFILGEAKTYNEEKKISSTAPIDDVSVVSIGTESQEGTTEKLLTKDKVNLDNFRIEKILNKEVYIHVATLLFKHSAEELKNKLKSIKKVDIVNTMINGKNTYKVIIGPFDSMVQLNETLKINKIQQYEDLSIYLK